MKNSLMHVLLVISLLLSGNCEAKSITKTHKIAHQSQAKVKVVKHNTKYKKIPNIHKTKNANHIVGNASFYGYESGPRTASGKPFVPTHMTAAHKTLPFGSKVEVVNLKNNKSVIVTINDRGPFVKGRIIDLSKGAAKKIGMSGVQKVSLTVMK